MNFMDSIKNGIEMAKLNPKASLTVAKSKNGFMMALLILVIAGLLSGLVQLSIGDMIVAPIVILIFAFIVWGIMHLIAKMFGGSATFGQYFAALGHVEVLAWVTAFAGIFTYITRIGQIIYWIISFIVGIWILVADVVITKSVHKLSTGKAVAVVLIPTILMLLVVFAIIAFFAVMFFSLAGQFVDPAVVGPVGGIVGGLI